MKKSYKILIYVVSSLVGLAILMVLWLYLLPLTGSSWQVLSALHAPVGSVNGNTVFASDASLSGKGTISERIFNLQNELKLQSLVAQGLALEEAGSVDQVRFTWVSSPSLSSSLHAESQRVADEIASGLSFSEAARRFSKDPGTRVFGGDAGYVLLSDLVPEYADQIKTLQTGQVVQIPSRYGLHVVVVDEILETDSGTRYKLKDIYLAPEGFDSWLKNQLDSIEVNWWVNE